MKKAWIYCLALLLCLGSLSGCQIASKPSQETEEIEATPAPSPTPEAEPEIVDPTPELVRVLTAPISDLDPAAIRAEGKNCLLEIYEPLFDTESKGGELVCVLADPARGGGRGYDHEAGSAVYTVYLSEGITDHEGNTLTAEDAVFCYGRAAERLGDAWPLFSKAEAVDGALKLTFTRELTGAGEPYTYLTGVYLYTQKAYEAHNGLADTACGTGPYTLESYTPGEGLLTARNDAYWNDAGRLDRAGANVKGIQYLFASGGAEQVIALETERADMSDGLDYSDTVDFRDGGVYTDLYRTVELWDNANHILLPNVSWQSIMKDENLRLGVFYAIDNAVLAESFGAGCGRACYAPGNPDYPDCLASWRNGMNCQITALDVDSVRSYLRQANYVNESFTLLVVAGSDAETLARRIQTMLRPMSITAYVVAVEAEEFETRLKDESAWDLAIVTLEAESSITEIWKQLWTDRLSSNTALGGLRDNTFLNLLRAVEMETGCTEENLSAVVTYAAEKGYGIGLAQKGRGVVVPATVTETYLTGRGELLPGACVYY